MSGSSDEDFDDLPGLSDIVPREEDRQESNKEDDRQCSHDIVTMIMLTRQKGVLDDPMTPSSGLILYSKDLPDGGKLVIRFLHARYDDENTPWDVETTRHLVVPVLPMGAPAADIE